MNPSDLTGARWNSNVPGSSGGKVTWSFGQGLGAFYAYSASITASSFQSLVRQAFDTWERTANIDFVEIADSATSNIRLGWMNIDSVGGTLGEATWTSIYGKLTKSEIAFDIAEYWKVSGQETGVNFFAVALHEIGHAIGLDHSLDSSSIMYKFLDSQVGLSQKDIALVQELYGPSASATPTPVYLLGTAKADNLAGGFWDDVLSGGSGDDSLNGVAGNDTLWGGEGNDFLIGQSGGDYLFGGTGNDRLQGDTGHDRLYGEDGSDTLDGGADLDEVFGGSGNDVIRGAAGGDWLLGEDGNDQIFGDGDYDRLYGGGGDDQLDGGTASAFDLLDELFGGGGNDILLGGAGSDWLIGGLGADTLIGGSGTDNYVHAGLGNGVDHITDYNYLEYDVIRIMGASYSVFQIGGNTVIYFGQNAYGEAAIVLDNYIGSLWIA